MQLNTDLHQRVVIDSQAVAWQPSPLPGVERRPLERLAAESGRTTSIVRYAAGSSFKAHLHPLGEEILVLDGVFADEHGQYPAGTWLKNPPGSQHAPSSPDGCLLFVKLCHLTADDQVSGCIDTHNAQWLPGQVAGLSVLPLDSVAAFIRPWCAGRRAPSSSRIVIGAVRRFLCWKALFRMNRAITRPALGCATLTAPAIGRFLPRAV